MKAYVLLLFYIFFPVFLFPNTNKNDSIKSKGYILTYVIINSTKNDDLNEISMEFIRGFDDYFDSLLYINYQMLGSMYLSKYDTLNFFNNLKKHYRFALPRYPGYNCREAKSDSSYFKKFNKNIFELWNLLQSMVSGTDLYHWKNTKEGLYLNIEKCEASGIIEYLSFNEYKKQQVCNNHDDYEKNRVGILSSPYFTVKQINSNISKYPVLIMYNLKLYGRKYLMVYPEYYKLFWKNPEEEDR